MQSSKSSNHLSGKPDDAIAGPRAGFLTLRPRLPQLSARDVRRHLPYAAAAAALIALVIATGMAVGSKRNEKWGNVVAASGISEVSSTADAQIGAIDNVAGISDTPNDGPVSDNATTADTLGGGQDITTGTPGESPEATTSGSATTTTDPTATPDLSVSLSASASFSVQAAPPSDPGQPAQLGVSPRPDPLATTSAPVIVTSSGTDATASTSPPPTETTPSGTPTAPTSTTSIDGTSTSTSALTATPSVKTTTTPPRRTPTTTPITKPPERKPMPPPSRPTIAHPPTATPYRSTTPTTPMPPHR
ncbi:hypothetical protein DFR76_11615 [Nocardia pseudobrasiliensis]|uniref:Uncharacterized protein n=1 Tax=Nocardia pseudobrasiliensis TaxID=45979 RepID=A0A370HNY9_9NOCA|nr:hypothetical protein DFR76_11615 [Nocardia pseudobrasiliensis]